MEVIMRNRISWEIILIIFFSIYSSGLLLADQIAITKDGKKVILKDNGTWHYAEEKSEEAKGFESIPKPIREVIFQSRKFSNITIDFVCGVNEYVDTIQKGLIRCRLISVKKSGRRKVVLPTPKLIPYILSPKNIKERQQQLCKALLAIRELKSIDFKNEYVKGERKIYAVTFTYTIKDKAPFYEELYNYQLKMEKENKIFWLRHGFHLPSLDKVYKGKAKAYLDPDDGLWKLEQLTLDRNE